jgi:hypothetical protein
VQPVAVLVLLLGLILILRLILIFLVQAVTLAQLVAQQLRISNAVITQFQPLAQHGAHLL